MMPLWRLGIMVSFYISTWQACSLPRTRGQKRCILRSLLCPKIEFINTVYLYIDTNEIPGELSHENMLSSHMKRSPLLSGYIINRAFHRKSCWSEMVWYFIGVYIINKTLHGRLEIRNFSSSGDNSLLRVSLIPSSQTYSLFRPKLSRSFKWYHCQHRWCP